MDLYQESIKLVAEVFALPLEELEALAETPPRPELGDLAVPCFRLAKREKKSPVQIAADMAEKLRGSRPFLKDVQAVGPYINLFFDRAAFAESYFRQSREGEAFAGRRDLGEGRTVLVEYSSPNIAKPFHVGHAFSTFLGQSLGNLYHYLGYNVVRLNHLGDYGTQFGKLIAAWERWGDEEALEQSPIQELTRVYVKFHQEAEKEPALENEARERFRRLEAGEAEETALWQRFRDLSLKEFNRLYERLHISFDNYNGESFYSDRIPAAVEELKAKNLLELSEGAQVVRLDEYDLNPCLILKSDGTTIYASRDIAAILYREENWQFYRNVYVVGLEQKNHFKQVFATLEKMGFPKADQCVHVAFGRLRFAEGAFSTRQGKVVLLEDFLNESAAKIEAIIRANGREMCEEEIRDVAEKVGVAAVKYVYLRNGREKDILFDWEEMLDFDGDTAPYLLYTYARARSVLRKAEGNFAEADPGLLTADEEFALIKDLNGLQEAAEAAAMAYEPCLLSRQLGLLARDFNRFYHNLAILKAEDSALRLARIALCERFTRQFGFGLKLLGIETVERM